MQAVVERAGTTKRRYPLGDTRQVDDRVAVQVERGREHLRKLGGPAGAEDRHHASRKQALEDLAVDLLRLAHRASGVETELLPQDGTVELLQGRARLDAEFVREYAARVLVHGKSLGLPAGAVQREHQLATRALT